MTFAMRDMMVEFAKDNGQLKSGGAESGAAVGESPAGEEPTAVSESLRGAGSALLYEIRQEERRVCVVWSFAEFHGIGMWRTSCSST